MTEETPTAPATFRKRPVAVEAMQWTGGAAAATPIIDWVLAHGGTASWREEHTRDEIDGVVTIPERISVRTLDSVAHLYPGDWMLRGVVGEFYPCKPEVFTETYIDSSDDARFVAIGLALDLLREDFLAEHADVRAEEIVSFAALSNGAKAAIVNAFLPIMHGGLGAMVDAGFQVPGTAPAEGQQ